MNNQERPSQYKTHRLQPKKRVLQATSEQKTKNTDVSSSELLSSISSKLHPRRIQISSENPSSTISFELKQHRISCIDQLTIPVFQLPLSKDILDYEQLRRTGAQKKLKNWFSRMVCSSNPKRICLNSNCEIKQRWLNQIVLLNKQLLYAQKLRQNLHKVPKKYADQIDKDAPRSFHDRALPKTKISLYIANNERKSHVEMIRTILKMLVLNDPEVGYVQGMNLYTASILIHMKQIDGTFAVVKQIMKYGNFRKLYVNEFAGLRQKADELLHRHVKILMNDLYLQLMSAEITCEFFMPFYLTMFSAVVEFWQMPVIIDQFLENGFNFLDKLLLSMLCYLKRELLDTEVEELALSLGANSLRQKNLPWEQIINLTQAIQLN